QSRWQVVLVSNFLWLYPVCPGQRRRYPAQPVMRASAQEKRIRCRVSVSDNPVLTIHALPEDESAALLGLSLPGSTNEQVLLKGQYTPSESSYSSWFLLSSNLNDFR